MNNYKDSLLSIIEAHSFCVVENAVSFLFSSHNNTRQATNK